MVNLESGTARSRAVGCKPLSGSPRAARHCAHLRCAAMSANATGCRQTRACSQQWLHTMGVASKRIKSGIKNPRRQQKARLRQIRLFAACAVYLKWG